jgi:hypothetical protein
MAPRNLETDPAADELVGDKTDQLIGEPDEAETEERDAPIEWADPWADH